ncbi:MAG: type I methionyl aminopeptidase [Patescibacteria group bacterium]
MIAKTKEEIEILREGGKRLGEILQKVGKLVAPGISTKKLDEYAEKLIQEGGDTPAFLNYQPEGAKYPYPASLCVSINDEVVHGIPTAEKILKDGDIVAIDLGLKHRGLFTDAAISVPVGKIDPESKKLLETTRKALAKGISAARAGNYVGDISYAIESAIRPHGYGIVEILAGHGVGRAIHEDPYVPNFGRPGTGAKLVPGMVIAIEPMVNLGTKNVKLDPDGYTYRTRDGSPSVHFEHTVLITNKGAEILT